MTIYIVGATKSGKTPIGLEIEQLNPKWKSITASEWVKSKFKPSSDQLSIAEFVDEITKFSIEELNKDLDQCIHFIKRTYCKDYLEGTLVIDGIRNPRDFTNLFQPNRDKILFIQKEGNDNWTKFESGIEVIKNYVEWLTSNSLLDKDNVEHFTYNTPLFEIKDVINKIERWIK